MADYRQNKHLLVPPTQPPMEHALHSMSTASAATAEIVPLRNVNVMNHPHLVAVNSNAVEIQNLDTISRSDFSVLSLSGPRSFINDYNYNKELNSSPPSETQGHCGSQFQQSQMSQSAASMVMESPQCQTQPAGSNQDKSDDDDDQLETPTQNRKCIVCLRRSKLTEDVFEKPKMTDHQQIPIQGKHPLLKQVAILISHLHIQEDGGNNGDSGICLSCLHSLQQWHIFRCSIQERRDSLRGSPAPFDDTPIDIKPLQANVYRNCELTMKAKETQELSKYRFLAKRCVTETDWDHFYKICDSLENNPSRMLEVIDYFMSSEKLTHLYCNECQLLQQGGLQGFMEHLRSQHTDEPIVWPCDICGYCIYHENYFEHWIGHFVKNQSAPKTKETNENNDDIPHSGGLEIEVGVNDNNSFTEKEEVEALAKILLACEKNGKVQKTIKIQRIICQDCGKSYANPWSFKTHQKRHKKDKIFECEVCQKKFSQEKNLKAHMVVHGEEAKRKFVCSECGKRFKKQIYLNRHAELHNDQPLLQCPKCPGKFRTKAHLSRHLQVHAKYEKLGKPFPPPRSNQTKKWKTAASNGATMTVPLDKTCIQDSQDSIRAGVEVVNINETADQTFKPTLEGSISPSELQPEPEAPNDNVNDNCNVTPTSSKGNDLAGLEESCVNENDNGIIKKKPRLARRRQLRSETTLSPIRNALNDAASLDVPQTLSGSSTTPQALSSNQAQIQRMSTSIIIHRAYRSKKKEQKDIEVIELE